MKLPEVVERPGGGRSPGPRHAESGMADSERDAEVRSASDRASVSGPRRFLVAPTILHSVRRHFGA